MIHSLAAARLAIAIATSKRPDVTGLTEEYAERVKHIAAEFLKMSPESRVETSLMMYEALELLCVETHRDERYAIVVTCPLVDGNEWAIFGSTAEIYGYTTRVIDLEALLGEDRWPLADILSENRYRAAAAVLAINRLLES